MSAVGGEGAVARREGDVRPDTSAIVTIPHSRLRSSLLPVIGTLISRSGCFTDVGRVGRVGTPGSQVACDVWFDVGLQAVDRVETAVDQGVGYVKYTVVLACLQLGGWLREQDKLLAPTWEGLSAPPPGCDAPVAWAKLFGRKKVCPSPLVCIQSALLQALPLEGLFWRPWPADTPAHCRCLQTHEVTRSMQVFVSGNVCASAPPAPAQAASESGQAGAAGSETVQQSDRAVIGLPSLTQTKKRKEADPSLKSDTGALQAPCVCGVRHCHPSCVAVWLRVACCRLCGNRPQVPAVGLVLFFQWHVPALSADGCVVQQAAENR